MVKKSFTRELDVDPGRLLALTDGIFGMVMTLLIFGMALPGADFLNSGDFFSFFSYFFNTVGITLVSFILLGSFWVYHHEFIKINNLNIPFLWLNILYMAAISFVPFSTSIIGSYPNFMVSEIIFAVNIFCVVLTFSLVYFYAYRNNFLEIKPSDIQLAYIVHTSVIIMIVTVLVIILDFYVSGAFIYLLLLIPVISTVRDIHFHMIS